MPSSILHLPNGQHLTVTPVFGGLYFKSTELSSHHAPFPPGWTVVINTEDDDDDFDESPHERSYPASDPSSRPASRPPSRPTTPKLGALRKHMIHRFTKPSMKNDHLYISSISQPSNAEFRPVTSPTRQIAMMLWATLWWYFHQPVPDLRLHNKFCASTDDAGKPKGEWRININREGIFKSKVLLPKLERMGIVASEESAVGVDLDERAGEGWLKMFVSRRAFWQLDAKIYLFTMTPANGSPFPGGTPAQSRPGSPSRAGDSYNDTGIAQYSGGQGGPFRSGSHLPTYYPPAPTQFVRTNSVLHPLRPKPPQQGEIFYTRFVPSVGQYLSFRVASASTRPQMHKGPVSAAPIMGNIKQSISDPILPTMAALSLVEDSDTELLHKWMNEDRVAQFWGEEGPLPHQQEFLKNALRLRHSIPVIGCWDGKPFGYFEIYWVKEDTLGRHLSGQVGNYDRGIHCLVGEQEFRGPHRVVIWLSALVHYCWLADSRTELVMMEPRVDNDVLKKYAEEVGFYKAQEVAFPHKQANLMKIRRDAWEAPVL